jgi:tRNA pseudouridine55 synthase
MRLNMPPSSIDGLLVLDKPQGITSRDAVNRAQRWFPRSTKLGHTGTLDPLATGVLVLCAGSATRLTEYVQQMAKTYRTTIRLGASSDSDDADGTVTARHVAQPPDRAAIEECVRGFLGEIDQVPPAYSAAKVAGQRAHALARSGKEVNLSARRVHIDGIDILDFAYPLLELEVRCGKGTYIRSLARDIGERLGCGGYVEVLQRTRVGPFRAEDSLRLDTDPAAARSRLLPVAMALAELPRTEIAEWDAIRLRNGQAVPFRLCRGVEVDAEECAVFTAEGALLGVGRLDWAGQVLRPVKMIG